MLRKIPSEAGKPATGRCEAGEQLIARDSAPGSAATSQNHGIAGAGQSFGHGAAMSATRPGDEGYSTGGVHEQFPLN